MSARTIVDVVRKWAVERPDRPAYTFLPDEGPPEEMTFAQVDRRARAVGAELQRRGAAGKHVLLPHPNGPEFVTAYLGCLYAGAMPIPTPQPMRPFRRVLPRIMAIISSSRTQFVIAPRAVVAMRADLQLDAPELTELDWIEQAEIPEGRADSWRAPEIDERTIAVIQYTSGSTAIPKGVLVGHGNLLHNMSMMQRAWRPDDESVIVTWLPVFHDMGLVYGTLMPLCSGFRCVAMKPESFVQRPARWLDAFTRYRGTHALAPNFAYELCVRKIDPEQRKRFDLSNVRVVASGSEPIRADTMRDFADAYAPCGLRASAMTVAYGLAEATLVVTGSSPENPPIQIDLRRAELDAHQVAIAARGESARPLVSVGVPLADTTIAIVDPDTCVRCPPDRIGEVWVDGPSVAWGYRGQSDESMRTFGACISDTGEGPFLRTGDLGFIHNGQLFICGRSKDLIIVRGRNLHPVDIELTVERVVPQIRQNGVAAFAIDDGSEERLVIVAEMLRDGRGVDLAAARDLIRREIMFHHDIEPARILFARVGAVPKTSSGKAQRNACRALLAAGTLALIADETDALATAFVAELARLVRRPVAQIDTNLAINQLGIDSIKIVELAAFFERTYGIVVTAAQLLDDVPIGELARTLARTATAPAQSPAPDAAEPAPRARISSSAFTDHLEISLFYFANDNSRDEQRYRLLIESAQMADACGFHALWIPERHFHPFGGVFPNPSVAAAALAALTSNIRLRAGSVVLPLHSPLRVAEEWALVDNLSGGRVDLAFAAGWAANDFVLAPGNYVNRKEVNLANIDAVKKLWRGESLQLPNGTGAPFDARIFPQPLQTDLSTWLTCTGGLQGFVEAGARGHNVLTALLFQSMDELAAKISIYREARAAHGHDPARGRVTLMLHTFVGDSIEEVRNTVRVPFMRYLEVSMDLWRHESVPLEGLDAAARAAVLDAAFERYFARAALFGTPTSCLDTAARFVEIGVDEIACLIDFGVDTDVVLRGLESLDEVRRRAAALRSVVGTAS